MAKAIAKQETDGTHFWPGQAIGTASHKRYPLRENVGVGGGYGVMQLTKRSLLSRATIWNWQQSVLKGMEEIKQCHEAGITHLNSHPGGVTDKMKRLEAYNRYNGGLGDRYHWWSLGPATNGGVATGWTKFGYIECGNGGTDGFRDYNNDAAKDTDGNPYNIDNGPTGANRCTGRASRYADLCLSHE